MLNPNSLIAESCINHLISELRDVVIDTFPAEISLFNVFAEEAKNARSWLEPSLKQLSDGAKILEVGAGLLILSCQLVKEGYEVTALEPIGDGFSSFAQLQALILNYATAQKFNPTLINEKIENYCVNNRFDFAFSVNVMEHIDSVELGLISIQSALKPKACYRFICPNYLFPYEPHFNIPIIFNKQITEKIFKSQIINHSMNDAQGTWSSLNWINVFQVNKIVKKLGGVQCTFERKTLTHTLQRVTTDTNFASRRSNLMNKLISFVVLLKAHHIFAFVPASLQPILDCKLQKIA